MSANVETMAYVEQYEGELLWHGLGTPVSQAMSSQEALKLAELDWLVESKEVFVNGKAVPGYRANVRDKDGSVYGIVSERYKIVQNAEAFSFTDFLLKNDLGIPVTYETAGSLAGGRRVWMLARLPDQSILGDSIIPYLVFTNSHDGKGAIRVAITPTRVVCQNTLAIAMTAAPRLWSTRHTGDIMTKIKAAEETLLRTKEYMEDLTEQADLFSQIKMTPSRADEFMRTVFPLPEMKGADVDRAAINVMKQRNEFTDILDFKPDLEAFRTTGWGFYNALADFESHSSPLRSSTSFKAKKFASFLDGNNTKLEEAEKLLVSFIN